MKAPQRLAFIDGTLCFRTLGPAWITGRDGYLAIGSLDGCALELRYTAYGIGRLDTAIAEQGIAKDPAFEAGEEFEVLDVDAFAAASFSERREVLRAAAAETMTSPILEAPFAHFDPEALRTYARLKAAQMNFPHKDDLDALEGVEAAVGSLEAGIERLPAYGRPDEAFKWMAETVRRRMSLREPGLAMQP